MHAVATDPKTKRSLRTASHTYVFQVGDVPLGRAFCGLSSADAGTAAEVNAAVDKAAADAVAAAQKKAKADAESAAALQDGIPRTMDALNVDTADDGLLGLVGDDADAVLIGGIVGGGALVVLGIVGMTVWYLRRLRQDPAAVIPPAVPSA